MERAWWPANKISEGMQTMYRDSDAFVQAVKKVVDFGEQFPDDQELKDRIVRLTIEGREKEALEAIETHSSLDSTEGKKLIHRIAVTSDDVFYLTGLKP